MHMQVYTPVIPNTGQRKDVATGSYQFWMIALSSISLVYESGASKLLGSNLTAIVDTGTGSIMGPPASIVNILGTYVRSLRYRPQNFVSLWLHSRRSSVALSQSDVNPDMQAASAGCATGLKFTLPGGASFVMPLNSVAGCTPLVPSSAFCGESCLIGA